MYSSLNPNLTVGYALHISVSCITNNQTLQAQFSARGTETARTNLSVMILILTICWHASL